MDAPEPTIPICSTTCTKVCHTGIRSPATAFLTDGTLVVLLRRKYQITPARVRPMVTEIARRTAGTPNGPGNSEPST